MLVRANLPPYDQKPGGFAFEARTDASANDVSRLHNTVAESGFPPSEDPVDFALSKSVSRPYMCGMKPRATMVALLLWLTTITAFCQGTINVGNGIIGTRFPIYGPEPDAPWWGYQVVGNGPLSHPSGTTVYHGGLLSGSRYVIEFWAGPASAVDFSALTLITSTTFRTGANPDSLPNGITFTIPAVPIPGVAPGWQARLAVRVWDTLSGPSFEKSVIRVAGNLFLSPPLGGIPPGDIEILPPNWVGQSFSLPAIPEPTPMKLLGLGLILLVKKSRSQKA
jgi:hypothetical protein